MEDCLRKRPPVGKDGNNNMEKGLGLVTVVLPIYNTNAKYLEQCINSVIEQAYKNWELICIDDCSTDRDTLECLARYEGNEKIAIIHLTENKGIAGSRNRGIKEGKGDWVCFLDHDDFWEKDYLTKLIEASATGGKEWDIVISGYTLVDENANFLTLFPFKEKRFDSEYYEYSTSAPWNRLIKKKFLIDNKILFPDGCLCEDVPFNVHCNAMTSNIIKIPNYGYQNRISKSSTSRSKMFVEMPYDKMPFEYLNAAYCRIQKQVNNMQKMQIIKGALFELLTSICCLFCCKGNKATIRNAAKASGRFVRSNMPHYIRANLKYVWNIDSKWSIKIIQIGLCFAIKLHIECVYCRIISGILKQLV